jgi:hypothetical protein
MSAGQIIRIAPKVIDEARQILIDIQSKAGHISPELVVKAARNKTSPLHDYFNWNNEEAGEKYRICQAEFLIRRIKLTVVRQDVKTKEIKLETTRAYISPQSIRGKESYIRLADVMESPELKDEVLQRAKTELIGIKKRYAQLNELAEVWEAIEKL